MWLLYPIASSEFRIRDLSSQFCVCVRLSVQQDIFLPGSIFLLFLSISLLLRRPSIILLTNFPHFLTLFSSPPQHQYFSLSKCFPPFPSPFLFSSPDRIFFKTSKFLEDKAKLALFTWTRSYLPHLIWPGYTGRV